MKHIFAFIMFVLIPTVVSADWVGMTDKRRYVTNEEKNNFPYYDIVRIDTRSGISTGVLVSQNIILTCGHCISYVRLGNPVTYYTTDGKSHTGIVMNYKDSLSQDYGLIYSKDLTPGPFLYVADTSVMDKKTMRSGYDSLKVLSNDEIKVVKDAFVKVLLKYKKMTVEDTDSAMEEIEKILINKDCSKSVDKTNCVNCISETDCIFNDYENLKVIDSCQIHGINPVSSGGTLLTTDCPSSPGSSGSPLIDSGRKNIIGINVGTMGFMIGNNPDALSTATRPEQYSEKTKALINMANMGLIEY